MLKDKIEEALNKQLNAELYSSYLYLAMSAYFESINLRGFATWMKLQAQEEYGHAMRFYSHIHDRGGRVTLQAIQAPPSKWESPLNAFEQAYKHEQHVTALINDIVNLAVAEKDHATNVFLQWFVTEQVEEEDSTNAVVEKLRFIRDAAGGLFMLDRELAQRGAGG